jgi:hypothetical protein
MSPSSRPPSPLHWKSFIWSIRHSFVCIIHALECVFKGRKLIKRTENVCIEFYLSGSVFDVITVSLRLHGYTRHFCSLSVINHAALLQETTTSQARGWAGLTDSRLQKDAAPFGDITVPTSVSAICSKRSKDCFILSLELSFKHSVSIGNCLYLMWWSLQINSGVRCIQLSESFQCVCFWNW